MASEARTAVDPEALAGALRSLGLLYGAGRAPATTMAGAATEADAIRAYLERERPHLLRCYGLESLVALVLQARSAGAGSAEYSPPGIERFDPLR